MSERRLVYLDNNATTKVASEVVDVMMPFFNDHWGNPSSIHHFGGSVKRHVDRARTQVADLLGCDSSEVFFTSCGTESNNLAIQGILDRHPTKKHIITSRVEHPAVLNTCRHFRNHGYRVTEIGVDQKGNLDLNQLAAAVDEDTAIVSLMYANNETGVIFPIEEAGRIVKEKGAIFHVDAVQAVGKIPLELRNSHIDLLSLSGHKLHAPKGIGVLYKRSGIRIEPLLHGGHQEKGVRGGTENVPYIVGLGKACELAQKHIAAENGQVRQLRDRLEAGLLKSIPAATVNGTTQCRLPNTTNISFQFIEGESILLLLDEQGICASSGSACTSGSLEPSHVLQAMKIPFYALHGSIRFSLSRYTTEEDVDHVLATVPPVIARLREMSPYWDNEKQVGIEF